MTSSFLNYSAENSLGGNVVLAASCRKGMCNKTKSNQKCAPGDDGNWYCTAEGATDTDSCYEDWSSDGECNPIEYQSCSGAVKAYPDCV